MVKKEPEKVSGDSMAIKELLRLERAKCPHLFDCGKIVTDEYSLYFPSVTFTCKICHGKIVLSPDDFKEKEKIKY